MMVWPWGAQKWWRPEHPRPFEAVWGRQRPFGLFTGWSKNSKSTWPLEPRRPLWSCAAWPPEVVWGRARLFEAVRGCLRPPKVVSAIHGTEQKFQKYLTPWTKETQNQSLLSHRVSKNSSRWMCSGQIVVWYTNQANTSRTNQLFTNYYSIIYIHVAHIQQVLPKSIPMR